MDDESEIIASNRVGDVTGYGEVLVDIEEDWKLLGVSERYE